MYQPALPYTTKQETAIFRERKQ